MWIIKESAFLVMLTAEDFAKKAAYGRPAALISIHVTLAVATSPIWTVMSTRSARLF